MAIVNVGDAILTVEDTAQNDREGRPIFSWRLETPDGFWEDEDLRGPAAGREPTEEEMARTWCVFLSAALEGGENADMFPAELLRWAHQWSNEIELLSL